MKVANQIPFHELKEGQQSEHEYRFDHAVYQRFLETFKDYSPLHVDETYAKSLGFSGVVMHGAILSGFLSHFVGMVFPGKNSMLVSSELKFLKPSYLGESVLLRAKVQHVNESERVVEMRIDFHNLARGYVSARGRVMVVLSDG